MCLCKREECPLFCVLYWRAARSLGPNSSSSIKWTWISLVRPFGRVMFSKESNLKIDESLKKKYDETLVNFRYTYVYM